MGKVDELKRLETLLAKKEKEKERLQERIKDAKERLIVLDDDIGIVQLQIITENLTRQGMTFQDLQQMLSDGNSYYNEKQEEKN